MPNFQQVIIIGHMGRDPEIRHLPSGDALANFSVATSEKWKDASDTWHEETEWHRVVVFGKQVDAYVSKYLHRGDAVMVRGKLKTRQWEKEGVTRYSTEIVADRFGGVMGMGGKAGAVSTAAGAQGVDDDLPF